jgi:general secretion pathway protein K
MICRRLIPYFTASRDRAPTVFAVCANDRGVALLLTLLLLSALTVLTFYLHRKTTAEAVVGEAFKHQVRLRAVADSAVRLGLAILHLQSGGDAVATLLDPWANVNKEALGELFPDGTAELAIVDLSGRFQINSLVAPASTKGQGPRRLRLQEEEARRVLLRLLTGGDFAIDGDLEARQLIDALVDWLDGDDRESEWGAESSYYKSLEPSYGCRNGPMKYIEELLLVRGMSRELFWGTPRSKALAEYVTVHGSDGRININTAPLALVKSLHADVDAALVAGLEVYRRDPRHRPLLADPAWYKNIGGWPGHIVLYEDLLTTRSAFYQVSALARHGVFEKTAAVVTEKVANSEMRILWRKVE